MKENEQHREEVSLDQLEAGSLFLYNGTLALKTEYTAEGGAIEAHIIGSGEMFWGGTTKPEDQRELHVQPFSITDILRDIDFILDHTEGSDQKISEIRKIVYQTLKSIRI